MNEIIHAKNATLEQKKGDINGQMAICFSAIRLENMSDEKNLQRVYDFCNANPDDIEMGIDGRLRIATIYPAHPLYIRAGDYVISILGILTVLDADTYKELVLSEGGKK